MKFSKLNNFAKTKGRSAGATRLPARRTLMLVSVALTLAVIAACGDACAQMPISVPNSSFESPVVGEPFFAGPVIDSWEKTPEPPGYDTNIFGAWFEKTGVFFNYPSPSPIANMDGSQGAFIFSFPGAGFFQDYDSTGGTNTTPSHEFDATYQPGRGYRLQAGFTTSTTYPVTEGATLVMRLYYRDASSNRIAVAESTVTYSTNLFSDPYLLLDYHVVTPVVQAGDPWAGEHMGIEFVSSVAPQLIGGIWDLDNVRLATFVPPVLTEPAWAADEFTCTLLSDPGQVFELLRTADVTLPLSSWVSLGNVTNTTGSLTIADATAVGPWAYYAVRGVP